MKRTQKLALGGIFSGLAVVLMFFSNFLPMLNIALPVFAGMVLIPLMIELNWKWTLTSYVVSSLLSLLLVRNLDSLILFIGLFGWYPILKGVLEGRKMNRGIEYLIKLVCFNAALAVCCALVFFLLGVTELFSQILAFQFGIVIFFVLMNLVFLLYDFCLRRVAQWYVGYVRPKIVKKLFK